ncbi:hypothetical protein ACD574_02865 [Campylobacter sp. LH-2024]|uniref:hypothetical protein n=1 Tax=Campylobacter sp. LH-2024 TaxID=3239825 RepID=UPI003B7D794F
MCRIYKDKNKISFSRLNFYESKNKEKSASKLFGAPARVKKHLAYKLGQAMIENSKNILGYIRMPFVLMKIYTRYKKEQKTYRILINVNSNLLLPKLKEYADYKEALKLKEHLSYKLGEALIKANNNWYGGGRYIKLWFEIRRIKKEFKNK